MNNYVVASYATSAFSAIVITAINGDTVTSGYFYKGNIDALRRRVIHSNTKGEYINVYGRRYYLHDFIRGLPNCIRLNSI